MCVRARACVCVLANVCACVNIYMYVLRLHREIKTLNMQHLHDCVPSLGLPSSGGSCSTTSRDADVKADLTDDKRV